MFTGIKIIWMNGVTKWVDNNMLIMTILTVDGDKNIGQVTKHYLTVAKTK